MKLWWIINKAGKLVTVGRKCLPAFEICGKTEVVDRGVPNPKLTRADAKVHCREGETPVAVTIIQQSEYEALRDLAFLSSHAKECSFFQSMRSGCDCGYTSARERLEGGE